VAESVDVVVPWSGLSPRGLAIVRLVMVSSTQGWSTAEIASVLGTTRPWVLSRMDELR
jgi:DNA-binding CsgD family transcriptional regulator